MIRGPLKLADFEFKYLKSAVDGENLKFKAINYPGEGRYFGMVTRQEDQEVFGVVLLDNGNIYEGQF